MSISEVEVYLQSPMTGDALAAAVREALDDGPFRLTTIEPIGAGGYRCTFDRRREGITLGSGNVLQLQYRLARRFEIVSVERRVAAMGA